LNQELAQVLKIFLFILIALVVARALMSWFPTRPDNPLVRIIHQLTEPLLEPVRRIMPRTGFIDLSAMLVIVVLYVMIFAVDQVAER
jgi:YggT family protein